QNNNPPEMCNTTNVGRTVAQRLNRREYQNTLRDLTGLNLNVMDRFPADPVNVGFDNNAVSLTMTPTTGEAYFQVAEEVTNELFSKNRSRVVTCSVTANNYESCAKSSIAAFGKRAFRRPLTTAES